MAITKLFINYVTNLVSRGSKRIPVRNYLEQNEILIKNISTPC